jgi:hypothetical protein
VREIADFVSGIIIGTLLAMCFRLWAFKRFVFPHVRPRDLGRRGKRRPRSSVVPDSAIGMTAPRAGHRSRGVPSARGVRLATSVL